jgi:hypothetical protein
MATLTERINLLSEDQLELLESLICKDNTRKSACCLCMEIPDSFPMKNPEGYCAICYCMRFSTGGISNNTSAY